MIIYFLIALIAALLVLVVWFYSNEKELENIPNMVNKAIQVPGFVFRNFAAAIQMNRSAILN